MNRTLIQAILRRLRMKESQSLLFPWDAFSRRDWQQAFTWMDLSGLAVYFLHAIRRAGSLEALPAAIRTNLEQRSAANSFRTESILEELSILTRSLNEAGVHYAVLKGLSLVPNYCPDPALRTQYDHDLLVDAASVRSADDVLRTLGYQRKDSSPDSSAIVYRQPDPEVRFAQTSDGLYSALLGRSVELHLTLWEESDCIHIPLHDDFLERSVLRREHGMEYMALCEEDCLLFQILHAFKHILRNWCRLSIFFEIAHFLNQHSTEHIFWNRFVRRMEGVRWAPEAAQIVFALAERLFGTQEVLTEVRSALETRLSPALALWIERYGQHSALSNFHDDKSSLFLHEEFIENPSDWAAIRRHRLFPVQRPHRPPAVVFQRDFSRTGKVWMESAHVLRRLRFHSMAALWYAFEYPRWILLRRLRLAEAENAW